MGWCNTSTALEMSHVPVRRKPLAGLEVVSARSLASRPKFPGTTLAATFLSLSHPCFIALKSS